MSAQTPFQEWLSTHRFSVSEFEAYQKCPYRFYAQSYLKVREEESHDIEMTPSETGQCLHRILEDFLKEEKNQPQKEDFILGLMNQELEKIKKKRPELSTILLERKKKRIARTLISFLEDYCGDRETKKTLKPEYLEWAFGKETPLEVELPTGNTIALQGRIDRIDVDHENKRFLVIDYKTGSQKTTGNQIRSGEALQLPIYIMAVQKLLLPDYEAIGGLYYSLSDMSKNDGILHMDRLPDHLELHPRSSSLVPDQEWDLLFKRNIEVISKIHENIQAEKFPSKEKACEFHCPYEDVCKVRSYWKN